MTKKYCLRCGSLKLIADRSLGGRLACSNCGSTLLGNSNPFGYSIKSAVKTKKIFLYLLILIFLLIVIL